MTDKNNFNKNPNGWTEWSNYVLQELKRLNSCYSLLNDRVTQIQIDLAFAKGKAKTWGFIGGILSGLVFSIVGSVLTYIIINALKGS